jgi:hypothetical protein
VRLDVAVHALLGARAPRHSKYKPPGWAGLGHLEKLRSMVPTAVFTYCSSGIILLSNNFILSSDLQMGPNDAPCNCLQKMR